MSCNTNRLALVIIDGLGDLNNYEVHFFQSKERSSEQAFASPLELASVPNLDDMTHSCRACGGVGQAFHAPTDLSSHRSGCHGVSFYGMLDPVCPGIACGSDTAHLNLLGVNPFEHYTGRGCFEAMGSGLSLQPGDIAFKSNFAITNRLKSTTVNTNNTCGEEIVIQRRADRNFEREGPILCAWLTAHGHSIPGYESTHEFIVKYATEHRCSVLIRGPGLTDQITGTDPLQDGRPLRTCEPLPSCSAEQKKSAIFTSEIVNSVHLRIQELLFEHPINTEERRTANKLPVNAVLMRGAGMRRDLPAFPVPGFYVAPTCMIAGLCEMLNLEKVIAPGATGDYHTDMKSKVETFLKVFNSEKHQFGFLHLKCVDDAGHDGNGSLKKRLLDDIDSKVISRLRMSLPCGTVLAVTGDHSTPVCMKDHSPDPVPLVINKILCAKHCSGRAALSDGPMGPMDHTTEMNNERSFGFNESSLSNKESSQSHGAYFLGRIKGKCLIPLMQHIARYAFVVPPLKQ